MTGKVATFRIPAQITLGCGAAETAGAEAKRLGGAHAFVVSDTILQKLGATEKIVASLSAQGIKATVCLEVEYEPSVGSVAPCSAAAKKSGADLVVGLGGATVTLAGTASGSGSADGAGGAARFDGPAGIAVDNAGNVCVTDFYNATVRQIAPDASVTTEWAVHIFAPLEKRDVWIMWSEPVDAAGKTSVPQPPPLLKGTI